MLKIFLVAVQLPARAGEYRPEAQYRAWHDDPASAIAAVKDAAPAGSHVIGVLGSEDAPSSRHPIQNRGHVEMI